MSIPTLPRMPSTESSAWSLDRYPSHTLYL
jgi:hypothetical protein